LLRLLALATLHQQHQSDGHVYTQCTENLNFETGSTLVLLLQTGALRNKWTRTIHVLGAYRVLSLRFGF
jgi:hypothetical protein